MVSTKSLTFRLQGCATTVDEATLRRTLAQAFGDINADDIRVRSLATTLSSWGAPATKTATLSFEKLPSAIGTSIARGRWTVETPGCSGGLILDTNFLGLTPLNEVEDWKHDYDCIAISGLASHPFGSWQTKDDPNRSWMWLRDALPKAFPTIRVILYGYDTKLFESSSFQTIADLGSNLARTLDAFGFTSPTAKPLMFLAHSLGGIVVKEALVGEHSITRATIGSIFFGVPSRGMETQALMTMVNGQPNKNLVLDLAVGSDYLQCLDDRFFEVVRCGKMELFQGYETKTSPTVEKQSDGSFAVTGPQKILVIPKSATRGLHGSSSTSIFAINENHSSMVKFCEGDVNCDIVFGLLKKTCAAYKKPSRPTVGTDRPPLRATAEDVEVEIGDEDNSYIPTSRGRLNGIPIQTVVDLTSGVNLVSSEWIRLNGIEIAIGNEPVKLVMNDGSTTWCPCINAGWRFNGGKIWADVEFIVVDSGDRFGLSGALIGLPFLQNSGTVLRDRAGDVLFRGLKKKKEAGIPLFEFKKKGPGPGIPLYEFKKKKAGIPLYEFGKPKTSK